MNDAERAADLQKASEYCAICPNMCRFDCPVTRAERRESVSPAGKVRLVEMFRQEMLPRTPDLTRYLYDCADCRGCETWCPFPEVKVADIMAAARADALSRGVAPAEVTALLVGLRRYGHPFASVAPRRLAVRAAPAARLSPAAPEVAPTLPERVLFLPGCTATALRPATSEAIAAVLTAAGCDWRTLPEHLCCGAPARTAGDLQLEAELASRLAAAVDDSGATTVVAACPGCTESLRLRYAELGLTVAPRVLHFAEYARELVEAGSLRLRPTALSSAVYHDPCTMTRRLDITAAPRAVIAAVPGLALQSPRCSGRETHCCGAGGLIAEVRPATAAAITRERLDELALGAGAIITTCPMCEHVFTTAQAGDRQPTPVFDLAELLLQALAGGEADD